MEEENKKNIKTTNEKELNIIEFWKKNTIFEKSLLKDSPMGEYVFYDGPPTANGRPGIHHLEPRSFKDAIPRYKSMCGYHVRRKGGWDTHGLPVELEVEKQLGLTSKKQIEEYGIDKFNTQCKESVWKYIDEWEKFTDRSAYWVDHKNPYVTYHSSYVESLWNVLAEVEKKGLLYKDYRIVPWCSRCGTALSSHELAQGYADVKDLSVTAKFKIKPGQKIGDETVDENTYILAWTTTPWTLPGNVALAVGEKNDYVKFELKSDPGVFFISAIQYFSKISGGNVDVIKPKSGLASDSTHIPNEKIITEGLKGSDLIGLEYEPLYSYFADTVSETEKEKMDKAYQVYAADFVTAEDGTGIVHTAVMYGQDDFELGTKLGLPKFHLVEDNGHFKNEMDFLSGRFVKDEEVAIDIIKDLAHRGLLFKKEKYEHSYPHCWRCKTPLIYYARDSWYIRMSQLRDTLVKNNTLVNWEPAHVREGRFGEWISDVKDWAISRERYWGTPLPVWHDDAGNRHVFTNRDQLTAHTKKSGNTYHVIRHGQCEANVSKTCSYGSGSTNALTDLGREQIQKSAEELKDKKIDLIYASPFLRTRQSAELLADSLGLPHANIVYDERLVDINAGIFDGRTWPEYFHYFENKDRFTDRTHGGETVLDVKRRVGEFLYEIDANIQNKNILIVAHGITLWTLESVSKGATVEEMKVIRAKITHDEHSDSLRNAGWLPIDFIPLPHNTDFELDLHRPYIDEYPVFDTNGNKLTRVKEVMDVWFDSGAMPFAQDGYPRLTDTVHYPADYIAEGMDQTRGWFYTLHAVGALMDRGPAFKNVICLGLILDKEGQKMSKSKGNVVSPWEMFEKYGADAVRFWMYSVNQPGDSKNFDERTIDDIVKKVFNLVRNVYAFYDLYRIREKESEYADADVSTNPMDRWILAKQSDLIKHVTKSLDSYSLFAASRAIRDFVDELSTWYVRRSRERLRLGDTEALVTLYTILKNLSRLMAPFTPFIAEELWQDLKLHTDVESVHLSSWPKDIEMNDKEFVITNMDNVRRIATAGNALRKTLGIPVRQPLLSLSMDIDIPTEYQILLIEELNVKNIIRGESIELDQTITRELKDEGNFRELVRFVQDTRKKMSLTAGQTVTLRIKTGDTGRDFVQRWEKDLLQEVSAESIIFEDVSGEETTIDEMNFVLSIEH